jgi:hypothetical protein
MFRYVVLNWHGGVYADTDVLCITPVAEWNARNGHDAALLLGFEFNNLVGRGVAQQGHPALPRANTCTVPCAEGGVPGQQLGDGQHATSPHHCSGADRYQGLHWCARLMWGRVLACRLSLPHDSHCSHVHCCHPHPWPSTTHHSSSCCSLLQRNREVGSRAAQMPTQQRLAAWCCLLPRLGLGCLPLGACHGGAWLGLACQLGQ